MFPFPLYSICPNFDQVFLSGGSPSSHPDSLSTSPYTPLGSPLFSPPNPFAPQSPQSSQSAQSQSPPLIQNPPLAMSTSLSTSTKEVSDLDEHERRSDCDRPPDGSLQRSNSDGMNDHHGTGVNGNSDSLSSHSQCDTLPSQSILTQPNITQSSDGKSPMEGVDESHHHHHNDENEKLRIQSEILELEKKLETLKSIYART